VGYVVDGDGVYDGSIFLYLPDEAIAAQIRGHGPGPARGSWQAGATQGQRNAGRVAQSAKSWLCHHAADRSAHSCHGDQMRWRSRTNLSR